MTPGVGVPAVLALIPARSGSKGIPGKNVMPIAGKPLIAHSIAQAKAARLVTRVLVSTDDPAIADVARMHGAETPFLRPAEFAGDDSLDVEVFKHALAWLLEHEAYVPDLVVHLRPTEPLRSPEDIDHAVEAMLARPDATALKSVSVPKQTPYKMWRLADGWLKPLLTLEGVPEPHAMPRQRLPQVLWQNGLVDVIRPAALLATGRMYGDRVLALVTDDPGPPLDHLEDVPEVERALTRTRSGPRTAPRPTRYAA